jgi:uncharacterized protein YndB with AHSA1/START domain
MQWILIGLAIVFGLVALMWIIGAFVPRTHSASSSAVYPVPPDQVWSALTAWRDVPSWRPDVRKVTELRDADGRDGWVEVSKFGELPLAVEQAEAPERLVLRIADDKLPFGGTWTYVLDPRDGSTRLTITEDGEVRSAPFRFMARFVFGYHRTMNRYLVALGRKLGAEVEPVSA